MDHESIDYYAHRERTERTRATTSSDPAVARVHRELAEHYAKRLRTVAPDAR